MAAGTWVPAAADVLTTLNMERFFSKNLEKLSSLKLQTGFDFLDKKKINTKRCRHRGLGYFVGSYVHNIEIEDGVPGDFSVVANCYKSMRKTDAPHRIEVVFKPATSTEKLKVITAHCSCIAGVTGGCAHVPGLFYTLCALIFKKFKQVPEELSCTSLPQQWGIPRGQQCKPTHIMGHVLIKNIPNNQRKRKAIESKLFDPRPLFMRKRDPERMRKFKEELLAINPRLPIAYLLDPDSSVTMTDFGEMLDDSSIIYHLQNISKKPSINKAPCGFKILPLDFKSSLIFADNWEEIDFFKRDVAVSIETAQTIFEKTTKQSLCDDWHKERSKRLCSSNFGLFCKRKLEFHDNFLNNIFFPKNLEHVKSIQYGRKTEGLAKQDFIEKFPCCHLHPCGLVVNPNFPFLAASPDALVCCSSGIHLLEIKCPSAVRNGNVLDMLHDKTSCITLENDEVILKENHSYYYQIQGQMLVTGIHECKLFIFTRAGSLCINVPFNMSFCETMAKTLERIYFTSCLPFLEKKKT